jgi:hypothetical protein
MPAIDLSILNQRQTPAFYADTLANRPAAGFVGRIFVSTNTFAFFRDNGTGWDLIGGPGTGTVTGSGAAGQVSFWNGANTITGNNDLFWDNVNGHLGIGTNVPGTALQIDHDQSQLIRLNQTTATNDTKIAFQNSGTALWRIGNSYNAGANDFGIFDVIGAFQPITVKKTTGQVLIGTSTVGSGKLVVASSTGDNGVQIVGAAAPSLRIDNAESGPTKRAGFGISTATNNFIQGSADRDFCMFNGSTTASPILFGIYGTTNVQEAARISAARNFLIGGTVDGSEKLQVYGTTYLQQNTSIGGITASCILDVNPSTNTAGDGIRIQRSNVNTYTLITAHNSISKISAVDINSGIPILAFNRSVDGTTFTENARFANTGNLLIGTTTDAGYKLDVSGTTRISGVVTLNSRLNVNGATDNSNYALSVAQKTLIEVTNSGVFDFLTLNNISATSAGGRILINNGFGNLASIQARQMDNGSLADDGILEFQTATNSVLSTKMSIKNNGQINIAAIATSPAGLVSGDIYSNLGVLTIVP